MSEKVPAIYESMAKVLEELDAIKKDQQGYGYKFRGINQVLNAVNPLFKKHKIITLRRDLEVVKSVRTVVKNKTVKVPLKEEGNVVKDAKGNVVTEDLVVQTPSDYIETDMKCKYVFKSLIDGSEIITEGFGEGQDSSGGDKSGSMATSNSYKYVIFEMFNIPTEEQKDSDQVTAELNREPKKSSFAKPAKQKEEPKKAEESSTVAPEATEASSEAPKRSFRKSKA